VVCAGVGRRRIGITINSTDGNTAVGLSKILGARAVLSEDIYFQVAPSEQGHVHSKHEIRVLRMNVGVEGVALHL
jgi:hypothetical protein